MTLPINLRTWGMVLGTIGVGKRGRKDEVACFLGRTLRESK